jgi:hypothetical protein
MTSGEAAPMTGPADDGHMRCHTCKHYRPWCDQTVWPLENQGGDCAIKLGHTVEIEIDTGTYGNGGVVDAISVDALWGCRSWEAKE